MASAITRSAFCSTRRASSSASPTTSSRSYTRCEVTRTESTARSPGRSSSAMPVKAVCTSAAGAVTDASGTGGSGGSDGKDGSDGSGGSDKPGRPDCAAGLATMKGVLPVAGTPNGAGRAVTAVTAVTSAAAMSGAAALFDEPRPAPFAPALEARAGVALAVGGAGCARRGISTWSPPSSAPRNASTSSPRYASASALGAIAIERPMPSTVASNRST